MFWVSSWESFALFSTDNRFEISVAISLMFQNLPYKIKKVYFPFSFVEKWHYIDVILMLYWRYIDFYYINSYYYFLQGSIEFIGRALAKPVVKGCDEPYDKPFFPPSLQWFPIYRGETKAGELLAAFEMFHVCIFYFIYLLSFFRLISPCVLFPIILYAWFKLDLQLVCLFMCLLICLFIYLSSDNHR